METVARDMNVADSIDRGLTTWTRMTGTVVRGHGVASGFCGDPRFPGGTIALQKFFRYGDLGEPGGSEADRA